MKLAILLLPETLSSTISGPADVLQTAALMCGQSWQICVVAPSDAAIRSFSGVTLTPDRTIADDDDYDLIFIPSLLVGQNGLPPAYYPEVCDWLRRQSARGARIASICCGAFLLAETGLLDAKPATTHWAFANAFRRAYPSVALDESLSVVDNGATLCCSANSAWQDLILHLLHQWFSEAVVLEISEMFQLTRHNCGQQPFFGLPAEPHGDIAIQRAIQAMSEHIADPMVIDVAIKASSLNARTFQRRFKLATGITAKRYLQLLRIHKAKQLLTFDTCPIDSIVYTTGYEDASHMRRLFKQQTGLSMREYRVRFAATTQHQ